MDNLNMQEQIATLQGRLLHTAMAVFLFGMTTLTMASLALNNYREVKNLRAELDRERARVTSLIAEVRGIGG